MRQLRKYILGITLAAIFMAALFLNVLPTEAKAASVSDLTYTINSGEVTITGCSTSAAGDLVIPDTIEGYPVTTIDAEAFFKCSNLQSITLPNSLTTIGWRAFGACSGLTEMTIPSSITTISGWAFYRCSNLKSITLPDGITKIDEGVFSYCHSLENITIPATVTSIRWSAFQECKSLQSVTIPKSVTKIEEYAFAVCGNLSSVTILGKLESIGEFAFHNCPLWHILFAGSESDWNSISILGENASLNKATRHFGCSGDEITDVENKTCTICNPSCAHTWDGGSVTKEATCKDNGVKTYTCTACGETKTEDIAKTTAHTPGAEATETTDQICTVCGIVLTPATGTEQTTPPTTEPPTTEPPATEPPTTEPPATEPPTTEPPATEPPTTEPPVTEPPATNPATQPSTEPDINPTVPTTAPVEGEESKDTPFPVVTVIVIIVIAAIAAGIILILAKFKKKPE